jgi:hypothetical protein
MKIRSIVALLSVAFAGFGLSAQAQGVSQQDDYMQGYSVESPTTTTHTFNANSSVCWRQPYSPTQQKQSVRDYLTYEINHTADWDPTTKNNAIYVVNHFVWDGNTHTVAVGGQRFRYFAYQEIEVDAGICEPGIRLINTYSQLTGPL